MNSIRLIAAAAVVLCLSACEKPAGPDTAQANGSMTAAQAAVAGSGQLVASALPALPAVPEPVFGPDFVAAVGAANLFEIAEARLALTRSANVGIKAFATMMIDAHTKAGVALQAAVTASGQTIELPTAMPDALRTKVAILTQTAADAFDRTYLADQVAAHESALVALQTYARRGDVPALKTFAADTAPIVEDHLARARALQASLK